MSIPLHSKVTEITYTRIHTQSIACGLACSLSLVRVVMQGEAVLIGYWRLPRQHLRAATCAALAAA